MHCTATKRMASCTAVYENFGNLRIAEDVPSRQNSVWSNKTLLVTLALCITALVVFLSVGGVAYHQINEDFQEMQEQINMINLTLMMLSWDLYSLKGNMSSSCPVLWHMNKGKCFFFSYKKRTWSSAEKSCLNEKANLAVINTQETQKFLSRFRLKLNFWIGLRYNDSNWKWTDGSTLHTSETYWQPGQPSHLLKNNYCVYMSPESNGSLWAVAKCDEHKHWICEKLAA
ncbi:asialoglycoprotein receptor 2-like [Erpetoichthys calabaricus]|nr:asialoglycoprotein receptor 2-like [Erpetoichthys calabaricus]